MLLRGRYTLSPEPLWAKLLKIGFLTMELTIMVVMYDNLRGANLN